jgi:hypothetical protein
MSGPSDCDIGLVSTISQHCTFAGWKLTEASRRRFSQISRWRLPLCWICFENGSLDPVFLHEGCNQAIAEKIP